MAHQSGRADIGHCSNVMLAKPNRKYLTSFLYGASQRSHSRHIHSAAYPIRWGYARETHILLRRMYQDEYVYVYICQSESDPIPRHPAGGSKAQHR